MRLKSIALKHFRGVPDLTIDLDKKMTVLVGMNGIGKSSVLDAVAIMLYQIEGLWLNERTRVQFPSSVFRRHDIQIGYDDYQLDLVFSLENAIGELARLEHKFRLSDAHFYRLSESLEEIRSYVTERTFLKKSDLLIYYRQDRGFDDRTKSDLKTSLFGPLRAITELESWWDKRDAEEARHVRDVDRDYRDPQLQAVRRLIKEVDGFRGISYSSGGELPGIHFEREDGVKIHVSLLSSGERSFIIILADLARRLQESSPNLRLHEIPAVVLIDEIELNLHPFWQSKIISTLLRVFQSCQFIVTTHSPQVVSSIESNHVRILSRSSDRIEVARPHRTKGQTSNYLLEGVFHAHERFPEVDLLIEDFNDAIDKKELERAKELYKEIKLNIEGDPPEILLLRKRLRGLMAES